MITVKLDWTGCPESITTDSNQRTIPENWGRVLKIPILQREYYDGRPWCKVFIFEIPEDESLEKRDFYTAKYVGMEDSRNV